jgi:hypothetical protein
MTVVEALRFIGACGYEDAAVMGALRLWGRYSGFTFSKISKFTHKTKQYCVIKSLT